MLTTAPNTSADLAATLLAHYSLDLNGYSISELIYQWQTDYPVNWLHLAVIEALYQGRYKAISVQQILSFWQRRGQVIYHFNMEFERLICSQFPESLTATAAPILSSAQKHSTIEQLTNSHLSPPLVEQNLRQSHNTPRQIAGTAEKTKWQGGDERNIFTSPSFKIEAEQSPRQLAAVASHKLISPESLELSKKLPIPTQISAPLPLNTNTNNPPIGQFTPETSDCSESFTSKLKAISGGQPVPV
jgi:hypothetical protein